jgi:hypothetical protein
MKIISYNDIGGDYFSRQNAKKISFIISNEVRSAIIKKIEFSASNFPVHLEIIRIIKNNHESNRI